MTEENEQDEQAQGQAQSGAGVSAPSQLVLPGVEVTVVGVGAGLETVGDAALGTALIAASSMWGVTQWVIGDLVVEAMRRVRDGAAPGSEWDWIHQATAAKAATVAVAFPPPRRRAALSWGHHELTAAMPDDDQDRWLDRAARGGWSLREMRHQIRAAANAARPELDGMPVTPWRPRPKLAQQLGNLVAAHPEAEAEIEAAVSEVVARWSK